MKILYDHQIFSTQKFGGISRYFYELISEFSKQKDIECEISLLVSNNHYISDKKFVKYINFLPNIHFRGKGRVSNLVNKAYSILKIKEQQFNVFHPTYYNTYFLRYLNSKPFVLTVYDMIHEKFRYMFNKNDKTSEYKRLLVEKATKIIAISQSTKNDLIEIFKTDESKIEIVYLGNSMLSSIFNTVNFKIPKRYIVFVGNRQGYKNFERFIKSVSYILRKDNDLFVVCAGGGKFNDKEIQLFRDLVIERQILQYNLDDESLAYLYKNALCFVFPSLYEGFGIPLLESFACGCPVVCSNISSLPEIAGDAAYYFDPYSEESIKHAIMKVMNDTKLRKNLIDRGYNQLKKFSWKQTAEQTKKIYESILK